jgi:fermentation-respiration switch protein FrsA (DUF1100 family)
MNLRAQARIKDFLQHIVAILKNHKSFSQISQPHWATTLLFGIFGSVHEQGAKNLDH